MRVLFCVILSLLIVGSVVTYLGLPEVQKEPRVLYWVVDGVPARKHQADVFEKWMVDNGYPAVDLRIEVSKSYKVNVVQGVSGVAGDILGCYQGEINLYQSIGLLEDVTDIAQEMGFDVSHTYPAIRPAMLVDGRQYGFPRNVGVGIFWVNVKAFEELGLPTPPEIWTFDEFERVGKAYVQRSNIPDKFQSVYLSQNLRHGIRNIFLRSMGVDMYNETMTGSSLQSPEVEELYHLFYRWTKDLKILATKEGAKALSSGSDVQSSARLYLFSQGNYGLLFAGRWALMYFREIGPEKLSISEIPYQSFRNTTFGYGASTIYKGSKNKDLAYYFLKFMASPAFNKEIIRNADGLPPVPEYATVKEFSKPEQYPEEWGLHDRFREVAEEIAISDSYCPFIPQRMAERYEQAALDKFLMNRMSAKEALKDAAERIENHILGFVSQSERLEKKYRKLLQDQQEIDRLRAAGEMVPLELITNPFYRRYYVEKGWSLPVDDG
ncbi:MAG: extracellular solute-binding protein [Opitutaceae bacterium]|nr:extracellular solute-binding protein [Opitutaceae bacterium]